MLRPFFKENDSELKKFFHEKKAFFEKAFSSLYYLTTITLQRA